MNEKKKERQKVRKQTSLFKRETRSLPAEAMDLEVQSKCCFLPIKGGSCVPLEMEMGQKVVGK